MNYKKKKKKKHQEGPAATPAPTGCLCVAYNSAVVRELGQNHGKSTSAVSILITVKF
jgi:hypothetical protein